MQYCTKCRSVCPDTAKRCPGCRSARLRPAADGDMVLLQWADMYTAQQIARRLMEEGVPCETASAGHAYFSFDNQSLPTDQNVFVPYARLSQARELAAQVSQAVEQERDGGMDLTASGPPAPRHIVMEVVWVLAFLLVLTLISLGAAALISWIKAF